MAEDVSKNTVMILLVLTVLVTILGTWTVLEGIHTTKIAASNIQHMESTPIQEAQVSLEIKKPMVPAATGQVTLNIEKPEGG